ncbi:MAG: hypothetical protein KAS39_00030, partial [Actinomycetia bacterium]|nr:hypothetical protein [Actinomycetes bacterium]
YLGFVLITLGVLFLFHNLYPISLNLKKLWPVFMILPGLGFFLFFSRKSSSSKGVVMPGTVMTLLGIFFMYINYSSEGWVLLKKTWPVFILIPGLGLLVLSIVSDGKDKSTIIPATILISISLVFFKFFLFTSNILFAVILIATGIVIVSVAIFINVIKKDE